MAGVGAARFQGTRTVVRTASSFRVFGNKATLTQVRFVTLPSSPEAVKRDIDELKKKAASQADYVASQSEEAVAGITEKAKQSAKEAWNATKDAAKEVQNTVTGKAEASAAIVKDNMEVAKKSMNTKK